MLAKTRDLASVEQRCDCDCDVRHALHTTELVAGCLLNTRYVGACRAAGSATPNGVIWRRGGNEARTLQQTRLWRGRRWCAVGGHVSVEGVRWSKPHSNSLILLRAGGVQQV